MPKPPACDERHRPVPVKYVSGQERAWRRSRSVGPDTVSAPGSTPAHGRASVAVPVREIDLTGWDSSRLCPSGGCGCAIASSLPGAAAGCVGRGEANTPAAVGAGRAFRRSLRRSVISCRMASIRLNGGRSSVSRCATNRCVSRARPAAACPARISSRSNLPNPANGHPSVPQGPEGRVGGVVTEPLPPQTRACAIDALGSSPDRFAQGVSSLIRRSRNDAPSPVRLSTAVS